jgi:hypothetical protein
MRSMVERFAMPFTRQGCRNRAGKDDGVALAEVVDAVKQLVDLGLRNLRTHAIDHGHDNAIELDVDACVALVQADKVAADALLLKPLDQVVARKAGSNAESDVGGIELIEQAADVDAIAAYMNLLLLGPISEAHVERQRVHHVVDCRIEGNGINHHRLLSPECHHEMQTASPKAACLLFREELLDRVCDHGSDGCRIVRLCDALASVLMHEHAGDLGKDEKVRGASLCARHKKADSGGHRHVIRGLPGDIRSELGNENAGVLDCIVLCVRDSKTVSHAGGAELLTMLEGCEDSVLVVSIAKLDSLAREECEHVVDRTSLDVQKNVLRCDHVTHFDSFPKIL